MRNRELHRQICPLFWNALLTHSDIVAAQSQSANTSAAFLPAVVIGESIGQCDPLRGIHRLLSIPHFSRYNTASSSIAMHLHTPKLQADFLKHRRRHLSHLRPSRGATREGDQVDVWVRNSAQCTNHTCMNNTHRHGLYNLSPIGHARPTHCIAAEHTAGCPRRRRSHGRD